MPTVINQDKYDKSYEHYRYLLLIIYLFFRRKKEMRKLGLQVLLVAGLSALWISGCSGNASSSTTTAAEETTAAAGETTAAAGETSAEAAETTAAAVAEGTFQYVSPDDAIKAAAGSDVHVLDVREWSEYSKGRLANSYWSPIFPLEDASLEESLKEFALAKLNDGKNIYIVCNSGKRGAEKATDVLKKAGFDSAKLFTVEGGAKALSSKKEFNTSRIDQAIDWKYIDAKEFLALSGVQVVDVRDADTYKQGHLAGSVNVPLKEFEDTAAQTAMYDFAKSDLDPTKPVYLLCYSGNKCAKTGISVLKDAGFDTDNLFIIKDGAKNADVSAAFVTE